MGSSLLETVRVGLWSAIVPPVCVACREPEPSGRVVCSGCRRRLRRIEDPRCGRCGAPGLGRCHECAGRRFAFSRAWSAVRYDELARTVVAALKRRSAVAVANELAELIAAAHPLRDLTLVPVPAHPGRLRTSGFNPAAEIARALGKTLGLPVVDALERTGDRAQVGLGREQRIANAIGSARLSESAPRMRRVALVDDVFTTGATLDACAVALQPVAAQIEAVTFARVVREARRAG